MSAVGFELSMFWWRVDDGGESMLVETKKRRRREVGVAPRRQGTAKIAIWQTPPTNHTRYRIF